MLALRTLVIAAILGSVAAKREQITFAAEDLANSNPLPLSPLPWLTSAGIAPSHAARYSLRQLQQAAIAHFGDKAIWDCVDGQLTSVQVVGDGMGFKSTCPKSGIKWLPVDRAGATLADPPSGNITLNVLVAGATSGCLTDKGLWQNTPLCGVFNVTSYNVTGTVEDGLAPTNNFTLTSLAGPCGAVGSFSCGNKTTPSFFQGNLSTNLLIFNASETFYSPLAPVFPGMKMPILTKPKAKFINVTIEYSAVVETGDAQKWINMNQR